MPVSKQKIKIPRLYLQTIKKSCNLSRTEFANIVGVSASTIDRYENGSCDFKPENMAAVFTAISELSGISASTLIQYETDYQKKVIALNDRAKAEKLYMPFLQYQKQSIYINAIKKYAGLSILSAKQQSIANLRLQHPDWSNKQISDELSIPVSKTNNTFFKIKQIALKLMEENNDET